jgi:hypothetical protein
MKKAVQSSGSTQNTRLTNLGVAIATRRRQRTGEERLTGTRRTVEQHTTRRNDAKLLKEFGVKERKGNHLLELIDVVIKTSNTVKRDVDVNTERISISGGYKVSRSIKQ